MSESRNLLCDTANSLFQSLVLEQDFDTGWRLLDEAGFPLLMAPEDQGGFGGDWGDAFAVLRLAGQYCMPLPLGEAIVAHAALAGVAAPVGLPGIADHVEGGFVDGRFTGTLYKVPWGHRLGAVLAQHEGRALLLDAGQGRVAEQGRNIAGEPRDTLLFQDAPATIVDGTDVRRRGAFVRVALAAGALDAALALAINHANSRQQFGRPLSKLQAVQQNLAIAATEAAAVNVAGQAAAAALGAGDAAFEIAAAKLRANRAIGIVSGIVHQVHGAIGFTQEYGLHSLTRRLMSWRGEFGGGAHWSLEIGRTVAELGSTGFWADLTRRSDRIGRDAP